MNLQATSGLETLAKNALDKLTELYIENPRELPPLAELSDTIASWYALSPDDAQDIVKRMNESFPGDMKDLGYLLRKKGEYLPEDFMPLFQKGAPSIKGLFGSQSYESDLLLYFGMSVEHGSWIEYKKTQSNSSAEATFKAMVSAGIFQETPNTYAISPTALKKIAEHCNLTIPPT